MSITSFPKPRHWIGHWLMLVAAIEPDWDMTAQSAPDDSPNQRTDW